MDIKTQKLEDITSEEFLDRALENAKSWCLDNLPKHLYEFNGEFDYNIFNYVIDNKMIGPDMALDKEEPGLIRVSTKKLKWLQEKEKFLRKEYEGIKRIARTIEESLIVGGPVEVDPESMFVHEITEFIMDKNLYLLAALLDEKSILDFASPHIIASYLENINREERGLKPWPEY